MTKLSGWDDTIVALATPPGIGAIGVIRLSGTKSFDIVNALFPSKDLSSQPSHTLHVGLLKDGIQEIDEVVVSIFKGPKSYTGEDVVEISCHGSPYVQEQVINACIRHGARIAKAGEFTQRAFLKGKLDLTQAEAVADLIASNTAAAQKTALHNIRGGFSEDLREMREQLIRFSALIELELDFATEDVEFADRAKFHQLIDTIQQRADELLSSFKLGNVIKNGVSVAIIGKPNAGKSTLLNRLLNENRAIVSAIAGTTRDTIEEVINIKGILFRLIDTAGIRSHTSDEIEQIGIERTLQKMRSADLVLYLFDVNAETTYQLENEIRMFKKAGTNFLLVGNKADTQGKCRPFEGMPNIFFISAKHNIGVEFLKTAMYRNTISDEMLGENTIITNARHVEALRQLLNSLADVKRGLNNNIPGDLLASDIRNCLFYLGTITGEITNEDKLDYIFSKFCIGK
jgi:tRNA modification GTPase